MSPVRGARSAAAFSGVLPRPRNFRRSVSNWTSDVSSSAERRENVSGPYRASSGDRGRRWAISRPASGDSVSMNIFANAG